jgi:hypothetical protein
MNTIILDKKKYVVVAHKEYQRLVAKATQNSSPKKMSLAEARKSAHALIDKWHSEK